jgi:hemoglobin
MPALFEHAGGEPAIHHLEQISYDGVLVDVILQPLFGAGKPAHTTT